MIRITITSTEVETKSGTSQKTGKAYSMRTQTGSAETTKFRQPIRLTLGDKQEPYAPGVYELDAEASTEFGRWGDVTYARVLTLKRIGALPAKAAA